LYVKRARSGWAIATRLGDLVRYLPDEPRLDPLVNAIWTTGWGMFPDGRTFLDGVTIVARGHFARLNGQLEVQCYWDPRPPRVVYPTRRRAREHAQRLRALLVAKLERDLDPEDGNLLTLSGGVDSTALAALAVGVVGRKVWSWSLLPSKENAHWHSREMSFIEPLAQQYGVRRRWEVHYHERLLLELWPAAPRIVFHVLHPALCSLPAIVREAPVRVMFGGECADEVCGSAFTVPDWTRDTSLLHLLMDPEISLKNPRVLVRWARGRFDLLRGRAQPPFPRRLLELDMFREHPLLFFHPAVRAEYAAYWDRKSRELREETRPWRYVAMHLDTHDAFVPMNWEACSALGIRRSLPFFNREALELMYECHPTELYGPKIKKLLRMALHGDVPARNLHREDKGVWGAGERKVQKSVQEAMPYESLPEDLEPLLSPDWCRNPPRMLNYSELRYLARLMLFIDSVRARRHERKISAENDRRLSREEAV
jgi:asparagine synthetase B (glutamine-hydrolysing)